MELLPMKSCHEIVSVEMFSVAAMLSTFLVSAHLHVTLHLQLLTPTLTCSSRTRTLKPALHTWTGCRCNPSGRPPDAPCSHLDSSPSLGHFTLFWDVCSLKNHAPSWCCKTETGALQGKRCHSWLNNARRTAAMWGLLSTLLLDGDSRSPPVTPLYFRME